MQPIEPGLDTALRPASAQDITWPALPKGGEAMMLAVLYQLDQSQWWPAERVRAQQFRQLGLLLAHARARVPFYGDRLAAAGFEPKAPVTPETWARIPVLTREDIQAAGESLRAQRFPPRHGKAFPITTSGSTGKPVTVLGTRLTRFLWGASMIRDLHWHPWDVGATLASIRNVKEGGAGWPDGVTAETWGFPISALYRSGPAALLAVTTPVERQVEWLQRKNPAYLITFPSNLEALARHCAEAGVRFPDLRAVRAMGEVLDARVRHACRDAWEVPVIETYSTEETGFIGLQCPDHECLHAQSEFSLVEILDESGAPCRPGETGRVVVTPLHNFATPLIRYAIGDIAEVGEPCACGRGLPVIARVMGRVRNMLALPTGERLWPSLGDTGYTEVAPISQLQVVQKTVHDIEVRVVAERELSEDEKKKLGELVLSRLGHPFALTVAVVDEIPRGAGGKYEDFRSEVGTEDRLSQEGVS